MRSHLLVSLLLTACQRSEPQSQCSELNQYAPAGVTLANEEERCAQLLEFSRTVDANYGMDFSTWLATVPRQRVQMITDAVFSVTDGARWMPVSFPRIPAEVPCGKGVALSDTIWTGSPLSQILAERPRDLYVSLTIDIPPDPGNVMAIRVQQDFNCDQEVGVMEVVGEIRAGVPALAGGWRLISSSVPPLDE